MTPKELKSSILQLAIQGKLVPQDPSEGTGEELYRLIQAEKQKLIKEGKIKKEKPLPEITEDEVPFDIPESWKWVRLRETANINGGFAFKSSNYVPDGVRVIRISDFNEEGFVNDKVVRHPFDESLSQYILELDNILLCMTGGTVGKTLYVNEISEKMMVNQRVATIKIHTVSSEYIYKVILSPITQKVIQKSKNSTNDNISMDTIKSFLIPLPPLAEQKRIVAKIEELLPLIDRYEQAWTKLEAFNKRFPSDMQKSLLQLAIQGKLVEQCPEEGTGEELYRQIQTEKQKLIADGKIKKGKPLTEIAEDEIPFEIPESWKWVRLKKICTKIVDGDHNPPAGTKSKTEYLMLSAKNINRDSLVDLDNARFLTREVFEKEHERTGIQRGDILLTTVATLGRSCVYNDNLNITFQRSVTVITTLIYNDYLKRVFDSPFIQNHMLKKASGTAQKGFYLNQTENIIIPLPPLAEQKRIVQKLDEILPLCEKLK